MPETRDLINAIYLNCVVATLTSKCRLRCLNQPSKPDIKIPSPWLVDQALFGHIAEHRKGRRPDKETRGEVETISYCAGTLTLK
ncbi:hypothetical protein, partial [Umezakia ovalisporum]|uniref:hypothetical protein n=1 Tax=Umezakia ovalisporum TaxID=75695 RepID=UPI0039C68247